MDLSPVVARLKEALVGFVAIGSAADIEAIGNGPVFTPSAFVAPMSESAEVDGEVGPFDQRVTTLFSVILVVSNVSDETGAAALGGLQAMRDQVMQALLGWSPDAEFGEPIYYHGGDLGRFADSQMWWVDRFTVANYLRIPQ